MFQLRGYRRTNAFKVGIHKHHVLSKDILMVFAIHREIKNSPHEGQVFFSLSTVVAEIFDFPRLESPITVFLFLVVFVNL